MANTHKHKTYTHKHSVRCDKQYGWSLAQEWDAIMTHVSVARPLFKLMGYEHRKDAAGSGGSRQWQTHKHTHSVPRDKQCE